MEVRTFSAYSVEIDTGCLTRSVRHGPRVEYSLSEFGESLKPILLMMGDWGAAYQDKVRKMKMSAPAPATGGRLPAAPGRHPATK